MIVTDVTTPAVTKAEIAAPTPVVELTDTNGFDRYPAPPLAIPTDWIVPPADTTAVKTAFLGTWYALPIPTSNSFMIPPLGKSLFAAVPVKSIVCPVPTSL